MYFTHLSELFGPYYCIAWSQFLFLYLHILHNNILKSIIFSKNNTQKVIKNTNYILPVIVEKKILKMHFSVTIRYIIKN